MLATRAILTRSVQEKLRKVDTISTVSVGLEDGRYERNYNLFNLEGVVDNYYKSDHDLSRPRRGRG